MLTGTCGTCGRDATATADNEGYSSCCNDRIEYGDEAEETKQRVAREEAGEYQCWECGEWQPAGNTNCTKCGETL